MTKCITNQFSYAQALFYMPASTIFGEIGSKGRQCSSPSKIWTRWALTIFYWQLKSDLSLVSTQGLNIVEFGDIRKSGGWILSVHFLNNSVWIHRNQICPASIFGKVIRTTLLHPNPYDPCQPCSKNYFKMCSSKLYLSFLEGGEEYRSPTNGTLTEMGHAGHLPERKVGK